MCVCGQSGPLRSLCLERAQRAGGYESGLMLKQLFLYPVLSFVLILLPLRHALSAVYEVGPGKKFEQISQVPLDALEPNDIVKIHYREEPYHEKFILRRSGTKERPIVITGIPHKGKLPVIDGSLAIQFQDEEWPQSGRWLIKLGDGAAADYVHIKNLHLRNANNSEVFRKSRQARSYEDNAAGVFVRLGTHVVISKCVIHSCGNGAQTSYGPDVSHVTLTGCWVYDNGNHRNPASSWEHNVYLCGTNTTVQFCRFGETRSDGNNIKDRGLDTVIRYNWIKGSRNRQLDLVDHKGYGRADAYVYGNVIEQGHIVNNNNMIHWGGDQGHSRSGTLYLFNNTVIGKAKKTRFVVVRYPDCTVEMKNNVFVGSGTLCNKRGTVQGSNNWFSAQINIPSLMLGFKGQRPGFVLTYGIPYLPGPGSMLINTGTNNVPRPVKYMPKPNTGGFRRLQNKLMDIGAYESAIWHLKGSRRRKQ